MSDTQHTCHKHHHHEMSEEDKLLISSACVITVSDRGYRQEREDKSGPVLCEYLEGKGYTIEHTEVVPDDINHIAEALRSASQKDIALIVTTGGTGFAVRDVTPEATQMACDRMAPGIGEAMRAASMKITPRGCLSRATAGIISRSLVVNVPGSPKAAIENLDSVIDPISHGLLMLRGGVQDCAKLTD